MNDLLKKLNVLVKASLNDIVSGDRPQGSPGKNLEGNVQALRERVNQAVQYEDEIKGRIRRFEDEAAGWDGQADEAVTRGDDAAARYAIEQMQRAEQRATMTQSDLREHQRVTQELIERVNMLEAAVADVRHAQPDQPKSVQPATPTQEESRQEKLPDLSGVLREAREKMSSLAQEQPEKGEKQAADQGDDTGAVDNDLDRRRQRLSKR